MIFLHFAKFSHTKWLQPDMIYVYTLHKETNKTKRKATKFIMAITGGQNDILALVLNRTLIHYIHLISYYALSIKHATRGVTNDTLLLNKLNSRELQWIGVYSIRCGRHPTDKLRLTISISACFPWYCWRFTSLGCWNVVQTKIRNEMLNTRKKKNVTGTNRAPTVDTMDNMNDGISAFRIMSENRWCPNRKVKRKKRVNFLHRDACHLRQN